MCRLPTNEILKIISFILTKIICHGKDIKTTNHHKKEGDYRFSRQTLSVSPYKRINTINFALNLKRPSNIWKRIWCCGIYIPQIQHYYLNLRELNFSYCWLVYYIFVHLTLIHRMLAWQCTTPTSLCNSSSTTLSRKPTIYSSSSTLL